MAKQKGMKKAAAAVKDIAIPSVNSHVLFDQWDQNLDGFLSMDEVRCFKLFLIYFQHRCSSFTKSTTLYLDPYLIKLEINIIGSLPDWNRSLIIKTV